MLSDNWKLNKNYFFPQVLHPKLKVSPNAKLLPLCIGCQMLCKGVIILFMFIIPFKQIHHILHFPVRKYSANKLKTHLLEVANVFGI